MRAYLHGRITGPAAAVVGVWDPLLPEHLELFRELAGDARQRSLAPVAIMLDPAPGSLQLGRANWPVYNDAAARFALIHGAGLDGILRIRFSRGDLSAVAADFFDTVCKQLTLAELWLGAKQSLGSGPEGAGPAIARSADEHQVRLRRLPETPLQPTAKEIRRHLAAGQLADAIRIAQRPPVLSRPKTDQRPLVAWSPGRYLAHALHQPDVLPQGSPLDVMFAPDAPGGSSFDWPDRRIKYLAFVSGPGDAD